MASCATAGFTGPLTAVHPRATSAFGLPVVRSLRDLPAPADMAFILAPLPAVEGVLDDMGATGIPNGVVLASGYRETGAAGRALEDALVARADRQRRHHPRARTAWASSTPTPVRRLMP